MAAWDACRHTAGPAPRDGADRRRESGFAVSVLCQGMEMERVRTW